MCFLLHARGLFEGSGLDIRPILQPLRIACTPDLENEYTHYQINDFVPVDTMIRVPMTRNMLDGFLSKHPFLDYLDRTDCSLIAAVKTYGGLILSDDGSMLLETTALRMPCIMLPGFALQCVQEGSLSKNAAVKALQWWEKDHRYALKDLKRWRQSLRGIG